MRSALIAAVLVLASSPCAFSQTQAEIDTGAQDAFELARSHAQCAGFWDFMTLAEDALGNSASSQNAHNIGNGARLSAGYMLSMRHFLQRPNEPRRAYGSWDDFIEPLAEVTATQMMAALEQGDTETIERQALVCRAMGEQANEIVNQIRAEQTY